jgi:hypothetical protein
MCPYDWKPVEQGHYIIAAWDIEQIGKRSSVLMGIFADDQEATDYRYKSHFSSCPNASSHSKKGKLND